MYHLKAIPEDFRVVEESTVTPGPSGKYCICLLHKRNCTTADAAMRIATALNIPAKRIGYAGQKDKLAITEQLLSIEGITGEQLRNLSFQNLKLVPLGFSTHPINLGDLKGNRFTLVVRNLDHPPHIIFSFPNYFDSQRFSDNNAAVGKLLIQRKFKEAAAQIADVDVQIALEQNPQDPFQALRKLQPKILILYVHAYQSLLFNTILAAYLKQFPHTTTEEHFGTLVFTDAKIEHFEIPLPGFGYWCDKPELQQITERVLQQEGIGMQDFVLRELPQLSCESIRRIAFAEIRDFQFSNMEPDELNAGKKKMTLSFALPKGSYATMAVRAMFV